MSTNTALDQIKNRAEEARPGPWEVIEDEGTVRTKDGEIMFDRSDESGSYWNAHGRRNAEFIAHARTDIPKLLAALEAVQGLLAGWEEQATGESSQDYTLRAAVTQIHTAIEEALR